VLAGRDAIAEIEVLNAADGERRFHGRDHQGNDGQLTGAGAGEFVEAVAVGAADRVRGQEEDKFAVGDGDLVEGVVDLAFPVGAGCEAGLVEPDFVVAVFEVGFQAEGEGVWASWP
jgi:hypothetical protein